MCVWGMGWGGEILVSNGYIVDKQNICFIIINELECKVMHPLVFVFVRFHWGGGVGRRCY